MDDETAAAIAVLERYSPCDISDALLKLSVPNAGFIPDLTFLHHPSSTPPPTTTTTTTLIAPASTVLFHPKHPSPPSSSPSSPEPEPNIPPTAHWADLTIPDTIVVIRQPEGQINAVCGGLVARRIQVLGARGVVVLGRVRDVGELCETRLPIWSRGTSAVGASLSSTPRAVQVPLQIGATTIHPGDLIAANPSVSGVVVIPRASVGAVVELVPRLVAADEQVRRAVGGEERVSLAEAFAKYRGGL